MALKALEIDDNLAEAHHALGWAQMHSDRDRNGAGKQFERALALSPAEATGHAWYGMYLAALARSNDAASEGKRALD